MRHLLRLFLGCVVALALLTTVPVILSPSGHSSPYMSALSDLAAPSAFAAPCPKQHCAVTGACLPNHVANKTECSFNGGTCTTVPC